jgi:hypothetical protein
LASVGIFLPYTFGSTGKYVIAPLFLLALFHFSAGLFQGRRRMMACDLFIWAAASWMIAADIAVTGSLSEATGSDALGFLGSYMVARTFIFGELPLRTFIGALRIIAVTVIALSVLDTLSGRFLIVDTMNAIFRVNAGLPVILKGQGDIHRMLFGFNTIRATSTFSHPILYGTFCSVAAAIFLYSEQSLISRAFYVGACLIGCILSISAAPLMGLMIAISVYCYDGIMKQYLWRWKVFWATLAILILAMMLVSKNPLGVIFNHFTFNPETGFYRLLIWQRALDFIAMAPFTGDATGYSWLSDDILSNSVDSFWLLYALLYGVPTILFLMLANLATCVRIGQSTKVPLHALGIPRVMRMRTAFSLALAIFAFVGLTVHFWDSVWLFWGLCIGIRASLEEYFISVLGVHNRARKLATA